MKRHLLTILALLLCSLTASAHQFELNGIYYSKNSSSTVAVTYRGNSYDQYSDEYSGAVTIPATVRYDNKTYHMATIGVGAFRDCEELTSITLPENSAMGIGICDDAFYGCSNLTSITLPEGVMSIGNCAFFNCYNLKSVYIPEGVTSIGNCAFFNCPALKSVYIPKSVTSIGDGAFWCCSSLTTITISEGVTSIGEEAFEGCSSLTSINIPESVTSIGDEAFSSCPALKSVYIPKSVTSIGDGAFSGCDLNYLVVHATNLNIEEGSSVKVAKLLVPEAALDFYQNSNWKNYCQSIESIEANFTYAFISNPSFEGGIYNCDNGTGNGNLYAPEGWQVNYTKADWRWKNFQPVFDGKKAQDGNQYFEFWGDIYHTLDLSQESQVLPAGTYVLSAAMRTQQAEQVTNQHIYAKVGDKTYTSATLGAPIGSAWDAVDAWQTLSVEFTLDKAGSAVIGATSTGGAGSKGWFQIDNFQLSVLVNNVSLNKTSAAIKGGETLSLNATVSPSNAADKTVTWTSSNTAVATVDSNGKVTGVGSGTAIITAKAGEKSATCEVKVTFPVNNISLSQSSAVMSKNETLTLAATIDPNNATDKTVTWSSSNTAVATVDNNGKVIAKGIGTAIITAKAGEKSATCEVNIRGWDINYATGHLTVNDNIVIIEKEDATDYPWYGVLGAVNSIEFGTLTTTIGNNAFANCSGLMTVTMTDATTTIGKRAFADCTGLTTMKLSENLTSIDDYAFTGCTGLVNVTLTNKLPDIGVGVFKRCTGLTSINFGNSIEVIGVSAFEECTGLISVAFPNSVIRVDDTAFKDCTGLKNLNLGSVVLLNNRAFENCDGLNSIIIPNSMRSIQNYVFTDCDGLANVTIPTSVTSIGSGAFADCDGLTTIDIPNSVTVIGDNTFADCDVMNSIIIPNSVTNIGSGVFEECDVLASAIVGDGVTIIGNRAFANCPKLSRVVIGNSVSNIKDSAFNSCINLTDLTIGNNVTTIGSSAFAECNSLTNVVIPNSVTFIDGSAFARCNSLTDVVIPNSVTNIASKAFVDCKGLEKVTIGELVREIQSEAFLGCEKLETVVNLSSLNIEKGSTKHGHVAYYANIVVTEGLFLDASSLKLYEGESATIKAIVVIEGAPNVTWSSDNNAVATVDNNGKVTAKGVGSAIITATADGRTATCVVTVEEKTIAVSNITLSQNVATLVEGEALTLIATVNPYNATNRTVTWSSGNNTVAQVDQNGRVTAMSAGVATITATADGRTATCVVTVEQKQPEGGDNGGNEDDDEPSIPEGDITDFIANPSFEGGYYNCDNGTGFGNLNAPEDWQVTYTNADWGWKNFQPVSDKKGQHGNQYFEFWGNIYHTLDLSQELQGLPAGTYTLSAAMRTQGADQVTNQHIYAKVGEEEFASATIGAPIGSAWNAVDAWQTLEVKFTLNSKSNVVIGATSTGGAGSKGWFQIDNFRLNYSKGVVEVNGIELDKSAVTLFKKDKITLTATVTPSDAINAAIAWSSDNTAVATVSNGVVTAVAEGTATITAKVGDKTATCVVTVEKKEITNNVADGVYYLYNVDTKKFLSRGEYWGTCATVDKYGIPFVWTAEEYSLKFLDNNLYLFETDDSNVYTDNASTDFAFEATDGGYLLKSLKSNRYLTIADGAHTLQIVNVTDDNSAAMVWQPMTKAERNAIVADYVTENYSNVLKAADIPIATEKFLNHINTRVKTDKTNAIGTARFNGEIGSWTYTEVYGKGTYGIDFCEMFQSTGYHTQTITGLEKGIYKVTMQGFERSGFWEHCEELAEQGYEITTATLIANGEEVNLKSWYSGKSDENYPNNTEEAVAKFAEGEYMNEVFTYVGEDGTLTLMVNMPSRVGGSWLIFNNFTLTHYSNKKDSGVADVIADDEQPAIIYDLMGRRVEKAVKGFYIINGKRVLVK